jgi:nicotinamide-nucleotide amidase
MNVGILCIGDELLIGQVVNTNASWLGEQLTLAGYRVNSITTVADKVDEIIPAFSQGLVQSDVLLVTGGLGPTSDDRTRDALSVFYNCGLRIDPLAVEDIKRMFARRNWPVTDVNYRQAEVPEACEVIHNPIGTSPGMWFEKEGKILVAMPGVPFEMKNMMTNFVLPRLASLFKPEPAVYRNILTQGVGESFLSEKIKEWEEDLPQEISLAYLPQPGIVRLRLLARGTNADHLEDLIEEQIDKLNKIIPEYIFGYDEDTLQSVIGELLLDKKATLSTAESCTGGYIAHLITSVSGSSRYYKGSVVAYDNEIKIYELNVSRQNLERFGAVSSEIAEQMAKCIRNRFKTDYGIAVTGIAGPDGGTPEKPVGLVYIALSGPNGTEVIQENFGNDRGRNISRTALTALNMLRKELIRVI